MACELSGTWLCAASMLRVGLLQYLEEPGEQHTWKHQFADNTRNFAPVNVNQFARLWVVADLADWQVYEGREPFYVSHPQLSRVLCTTCM